MIKVPSSGVFGGLDVNAAKNVNAAGLAVLVYGTIENHKAA
jgi:hypothetical protein